MRRDSRGLTDESVLMMFFFMDFHYRNMFYIEIN